MHNIKIGDKDVKFVRSGGEVVYPKYIKDGLVLWYDFSGRSNTDTLKGIAEDLSGNGNDGSLQNFAFDEGSGYAGNGLEFDGVDDYVQGNEELNWDNDSFSFEFIASIYESVGQPRSMFGMFGDGSNYLGYENNTKILTLSYVSTNEEGEGRFQRKDDYTQVFDDISKLRAVTVVFDVENSVVRVYVNSVLTGSRPIIGNLSNLNNPSFRLLGWQGRLTIGSAIKSDYKSVRKYNRLLTPQEIAQNYKIDKHRFNIEEI